VKKIFEIITNISVILIIILGCIIIGLVIKFLVVIGDVLLYGLAGICLLIIILLCISR
jgi:hypothetical protein